MLAEQENTTSMALLNRRIGGPEWSSRFRHRALGVVVQYRGELVAKLLQNAFDGAL